jgi:hypothetical protein
MNRARLVFVLTATILGALLAGPLAAPVAAGNSCNGSGSWMVVIYENSGFWGDPGGPGCVGFNASVSNLKSIPFSDGGNTCNGQYWTSYNTWNDCTSSVKVSINCHYKVAMYKGSDYTEGTLGFSASYNYSTMPSGWDNVISSIKITYSSICQTEPAP